MKAQGQYKTVMYICLICKKHVFFFLLSASEVGLLPSARLGPFPDEASWESLQEHDRPIRNQLPGSEIAPKGLPAWFLSVAAVPAVFNPFKRHWEWRVGGWMPAARLLFPPSLPHHSLFLASRFTLFASSLYCGCGNRLSSPFTSSPFPVFSQGGVAARVESALPLLLCTQLMSNRCLSHMTIDYSRTPLPGNSFKEKNHVIK